MSTSIGFQNPINGSNDSSRAYVTGDYLGKGMPGYIPPALLDTEYNGESALNRFMLREAWNTRYQAELQAANKKRIITPFRAVTNSGDLLCRQNYSCGGPCQTFQSRPGLYGLRKSFGHIQDKCDGTKVPPSSCNPKYVYDSSDYITYKKQSALVKNYNTLTNGGNQSSGSQVAFKAIRRY